MNPENSDWFRAEPSFSSTGVITARADVMSSSKLLASRGLTTGMNGGGTSRALTLSQLMGLKKGCFSMSARPLEPQPRRFLTSRVRSYQHCDVKMR